MAFEHLDRGKFIDEREAIAEVLLAGPLIGQDRDAIRLEAEALVRTARKNARHQGVVESFLQEFSLSTREGMALMCLAEALLRTPDEETRQRLIAEKIASADWASHAGRSESVLVNASAWSLMLTGKLIDPGAEARADLPSFIKRLAGRLGEPVIRRAVGAAVRIMSEQFVLGATIDKAIRRAADDGFTCSFDMLGEGARTAYDAARYERAYADAIGTVGRHGKGRGPEAGHGVSVKLSALSPCYEARQVERVFAELYPRILRLCVMAAEVDINLTLDAEETDRLVISLEILDRLAREPSLGPWSGLGLAVQAYQKRGPRTIEAVACIAKDSGRRLMVRLVKGAYWDSEIKRAQMAGYPGYPVYTTKAATDVSYLVCAKVLLAAAPALYGQFATHNAHTLATVREMSRCAGLAPEFQRLHGMGEALYAAARERYGDFPVRVYAPVGSHEDLLPYLVRRLLENGANTSFVHALLDERTPVHEVVVDPIAAVEAAGAGPHPRIPLPRDLYGPARRNSEGLDLSIGEVREQLSAAAREFDIDLARIEDATPSQIDAAFAAARGAQAAWDALGGEGRGKVLRAMGNALEAHRERLIAICVREAGKTLADAIAEVREATDFCRYYAYLAERQFGSPEIMRGPVGETNQLTLHGRGVFVCISPWNFPLAIFTGQVAAALAAGNGVIAKPAEQTPIVAAEAVKLFQAAGLPSSLLHLTAGDGRHVGQALVSHVGCDGVAFTGGTDTALAINRTLAARQGPIVPFIAETGGLNAMFVDTTALREQVLDDVLVSAFGSAGQRCSALRMLFLPHQTADTLIKGLTGSMDTLLVGDPADPCTDVGPLIDAEAQTALKAHLQRLQRDAIVVHAVHAPKDGFFFGPVLAEIPSPSFLQQEVFGPILHVIRYDPARLDEVAGQLAGLGYGLTLGVHSRLDGFANAVRRAVPAGNVYVNRSMIGAVVGVQPFGGEGLSGTGPKAGGPWALTRYAVERAVTVNTAARGGDPALLSL